MPKRTTVYQAVKNFHREVGTRGRKLGYRKTTPEEDKAILSAFFRARQPCGSEVVYKDVWCALPDHLRARICVKTVKKRLAEQGYHLEDKLAADDRGRDWRKRRVAFCTSHKDKTQEQWVSTLQAVADFKEFTYFPRSLKTRHKQLNCKRTIMAKSERAKPNFLKPRDKMFTKKDFRKTSKAKVFGITTTGGSSLVCPSSPRIGLRFSAAGWRSSSGMHSPTRGASPFSWMARRSCTPMKPKQPCRSMECDFYRVGLPTHQI